MQISHQGYFPSEEHLRLIARVARMYHERGKRQAEIATELHLSQSRVSRMLKRASEIGIVRTTVALPPGVHTDLEEQLEERFQLNEVVVVDTTGNDEDVTAALGAAAAHYLETTLSGNETIGISSWSATLLAAVNAMRPARQPTARAVVQAVGGLGDPRVQMQATRILGRLAECTMATPVFTPAPGLLSNPSAKESLLSDATLVAVSEIWSRLTIILMGVGSLEPSTLLRQSGNSLQEADQQTLRDAGAVGDVCLRFFSSTGAAVASEIDRRVLGIPAEQIHQTPRRVGVAGGPQKVSAVLGAVLGGWINVLITDQATAQAMLNTTSSPTSSSPAC